MDWLAKHHKWLAAIAAIFSAFSYWAGYMLLQQTLLSGSEFVALVIAATATSLVILFMPSIQELSIGGNIIRLRDAKVEADKTVQNLQAARSSMLVAALSSLRRSKLDLNEQSSGVDDRFSYFLSLYKTNQDLLEMPSVLHEFQVGAEKLLSECWENINRHYLVHHDDNLGCQPKPERLENWLTQKNKLSSSPKDLPFLIKAYRELFELHEKIK